MSRGIERGRVCSLAKRLEEVFLPSREESIMLPQGSEAPYLVTRIRDEARRFVIGHHRSLRGKAMTESALDGIPGVGPARRRALSERFGSVRDLRGASPEQLTEVERISGTLARGPIAGGCAPLAGVSHPALTL